ncbi:30S ribosomal protein S16 [Patescibacteria group bacterium]|nr:30S ribosomal protein S16 [Patescibacteria group bacterium]
MLKIRLQRVGKKHDPSFRVLLTDSRRGPKSGDFIENLGFYDAIRKVKQIKADRVKHWIANGAQVSDTVHNILVSENIIEGKKKNVLPKKSPVINEAKLKAEAEAKAKAEAKLAEEKATAEASVEAEATPEETIEEVTETPAEEVTETPVEEVKEETPVEEKKKEEATE